MTGPPMDAWRPAPEVLAATETAYDLIRPHGATTPTKGGPVTTPATEPTPERVADMFTESDNDYHDGWDWKPGLSADGNVVRIRITPYSEDGDECAERHFRAVVVEGETVPLVIDRAVFEARVHARFDAAIRKLGESRPEVWPAHIAALREQILAADVELAEDTR